MILFRFYSLWDTGYAKIHIPIIASVSEHQPTPWFSFFFDLHILACVFPAGLWHCIKNVNDRFNNNGNMFETFFTGHQEFDNICRIRVAGNSDT